MLILASLGIRANKSSGIGGVGVVAIGGAYDEIHATPEYGSQRLHKFNARHWLS